MTKAGVLIGIVGTLIAVYAAVFPVPQYFARLDSRISQLEEQMRSVTALSGSTSEASVRLDGRVNQLDEKVRSLAAASASTAAAIDAMSKKPMVAVNPMFQKCVELADEANTGQRYTYLGGSYGSDVTKNALMAMEKLGCSSMAR